MTFRVPPQFEVFGIPQSERSACNIDCDVVELVRIDGTLQSRWFSRRRKSRQYSYFAYVRLPPWVTPPERWARLLSGEVQLWVSLDLNKRVTIPDFPKGSNHLVIESGASTTRVTATTS